MALASRAFGYGSHPAAQDARIALWEYAAYQIGCRMGKNSVCRVKKKPENASEFDNGPGRTRVSEQ